MVGAASALIEAERAVPRGKKRPDWSVKRLYKRLEENTRKGNSYRHTKDEEWRSWVGGFHLGSAMFRIQAAIDRSINEWLFSLSNGKLGDPSDLQRNPLWLSRRIALLKKLLEEHFPNSEQALKVNEKLDALLKAQGPLKKGRFASQEPLSDFNVTGAFLLKLLDSMTRVGEFNVRAPVASVEHLLALKATTDAQCLVAIFSNVNLYKHGVGGPAATHGDGFEIQLVMARKSLCFIRDAWVEMYRLEQSRKGKARYKGPGSR
jgi:hypothetical protein